MNTKTLVVVCGYAGDAPQIEALLPVYEHHQCPIVVMSPEDAPIPSMHGHIVRFGGKRAYIGQLSLDRQILHMRMALEYRDFDWFLLNDSDSFVITPELPSYLYNDKDTVWSNQVEDFRKPGETWTDANGTYTWPADYHAGHPLIAMQPPYFMHRNALEKMVAYGVGIQACPTTPFIDWCMVQFATAAQLTTHPFRTGASCETVTQHGIAVMSERITKYGATFLHAVKSREVLDHCLALHKARA